MKRAAAIAATLLVGTGVYIFGAPEITPEQIAAYQEQYYQNEGKYLQILEGNRLPHYETGTVQGKFGRRIPDGMSVDVYDGPLGKGIIVRYEDAENRYSIGFGPEAEKFTFTTPIPQVVASTTK